MRTPELVPPVTFDANTQAWLRGKPTIRVAYWGQSLAPLSIAFYPDEFEGVTADVLGLLQKMLGVPLQMLHFEGRNEALLAMAKGEVEMLALNDVTAGDQQLFKPTRRYLLNHRVMVRRINDPRGTSASLSGERLAYINTGDSNAKLLQKQYPHSTLVPYADPLNALSALAYDQADVFCTDAVTAQFIISRFYRNDVYVVGDVTPAPATDLNFAVSVGQPQLLEAINQSLEAIPVASMLHITSRWGLGDTFVVARSSPYLSPEQTAWVAEHPKLRVIVTNAFAPLTFFDEHDQFKGVSADLLKKIERATGLEFEIVRSNSVNDTIVQLQDNKVDLIAALSMGDYPLNQNQLTRPYLVSPFVVMTRRSESDIRSLDELNGLHLAIPWGSPLTLWLREHYPKINLITVRAPTQGIEMLAAEEVEGAVSTQFNADYFITHHFQSDLHIASVIGPSPAMIVMAVAPDDQVLKEIINATLLTIAPEEFKDMIDRWRNNTSPAVASPWNAYKDLVFNVMIVAALLVAVFLVWNFYLRVQIQKRQKAERALGDQLEFSRTLIDGAPVALYVRDQHGRLAQCNEAYLGFLEGTREDFIGKTLIESQIFSAEINATYHQVYLDTLKRGQPVFADIDVVVKGKQHRLYHWILPFHDVSGKYTGVIGGWLDVSEREYLIEQLRVAKETAMNASRSKSVFLASMSHEIRTPVSALVGLIELLRLKGGSAAQVEENLEVAHQSAQSLLSLIGDVLDLSKIEAGEMNPVPRPTHLGEMAQSIYRLFETNARNKNLEFRLVTEVKHNGVLIDALMLNQVVANLLSNAIKFTDHGSVQLLVRELPGTSTPGRGRFAIQISDSGIGLNETQRQEIFEPFVQADAHAHRAVGTGLGLSICASLAKLLDAQLSVDSQPGIGSRFTLLFEADLVEIEQSPATAVVDPSLTHKLRILVVDDHAPNRLLLCRQLEYLGHEAVPCDDGEAALAVWMNAEPPFDLTITDCSMPRMNGYELTRNMREAEQQNAERLHPIFGLTANAQAEITERCLEAGMTRCLFKPVGMETLSSLIAEVEQTCKRRAQVAVSTGSELDKIRLLSPESYAPLVNEMVRTHRQDGQELERLVVEENWAGVARVAHKIRGGAQLAGDSALTNACQALEQRVEEGEAVTYRSEVERVLYYLQVLEVRLLKSLFP